MHTTGFALLVTVLVGLWVGVYLKMSGEKPGAEDYLSIREAAELMRCSQRMLQTMAKDGAIPAFRLGKRLWRIPRGQFLAHLRGSWDSYSDEAKAGSGISTPMTNTEEEYANLLAKKTRRPPSVC